MDSRRPSGSGPNTPPLSIAPSAFHDRRGILDRRYSDASNVLPIDINIDHRQHSSSGSSGSQCAQEHDPYSSLVNAAGIPTPPGSSVHNSIRSLNGNGSVAFSQLTISEQDDPAVYNHMYASSHAGSLSPLSAGAAFRGLPSPQSPLLISPTRSQRQHPFQQLQVPCTCIFYELENANMALYPPGDMDNQTPLYSIHVAPSCFQPMSFVTTIKRGGTNSKQLVARFELGISRDPPTLFMDNRPYQLQDVFHEFRKVKSKLKQDRWRWVRGQCKLQWFYSSDYEAICHYELDPDRTPLAKLLSAAGAYAPGGLPPSAGPPTTKLMVMTPNQALLDEIVVSALLVERKRLTPVDGNQNKDLFN
ncbi:hypothetical protein BDY19DRAFT_62284 [Irpex rosettiformis]|uniref:Uncharacterized protein n=1 Tax=Irpex rosettiformis TaxID=378272 RepID=A0ACB8ULE8_9APHY|nr:hypothetical protein BDY19DRAFT_62284 [Irpex rosettiformis]